MKPEILLCCAVLLPSMLTAQTFVYYHFDGTNGEAAGTIVDSSANGLDGSVVGTAAYASGPVGSCLDLTGDFNYVTIPGTSSLVLSNSWTVEMLFRINVPYVTYGSDPAALVNKLNTPYSGDFLDSFSLQLGSAGVISAQIGFGNLTGQYFSIGGWKLFGRAMAPCALVYNVDAATGTNTLSLYADYALEASVSAAFPPIEWEGYPINIGAGNYPNNDPNSGYRRNLDGQVDEFKISNVALTPNQFVSVSGGRPAPLAIQAGTGGVALRWGSISNETYQLQACTELSIGSWLDFGGPIVGAGGRVTVPDAYIAGRTQRFYQLLMSP